MERKIKFEPEEYYHIYNRGNDKRNIFLDEFDFQRFLKLLYLCNGNVAVNIRELPKGSPFGVDKGEALVDIGLYALMPNHFHLVVRERGGGGISTFMGKLSTGYSMYFNRKYSRTGALFEGKFKAIHVSEDQYLEYLYSYVHLNPVKMIEPMWKEEGIKNMDRVKDFLRSYKYSSYYDFYASQNRDERAILNTLSFPGYFSSSYDFEDLVSTWLTLKEQSVDVPKGGPLGTQGSGVDK